VCKGDPRLVLSGTETSCDLSISDMSVADWGTWMCLVNDDINFSTARERIDLEVGKEGELTMSAPGIHPGLDGEKIIRLTEGTQRQIDCHVTEAHPAPDIQWEGPLEPEPHRRQLDRVKKYVKKYEESRMEEESFSGNITIINKGTSESASHGLTVNTVSSILYSANLNDTNSTIRCEMRQVDRFGGILYSSSQYIRVIVEPLPPPLPVISYAEKVGIVTGTILSCLFILLLCILITLFMCRRERRRKPSTSPSESSTPPSSDHYQIKPIWTTRTSSSTSSRGIQSLGSRYPRLHEQFHHHSTEILRSASVDGHHTDGQTDNSSDYSNGSPGSRVDGDRSCLQVYTVRDEYLRQHSKDSSKRSSASFETERSLAEMETGSVTFHPAPSLQGSDNLTLDRSLQGSVTLHPAPSLHETHFGVGRAESPLTILHPPGILVSLPDKYHPISYSSTLDTPWRKISSTKSEGGGYTPRFTLPGSRPASSLGVNLGPTYKPQRLSTPTCPGSLMDQRSTNSLFQCPHDCFQFSEELEEQLYDEVSHETSNSDGRSNDGHNASNGHGHQGVSQELESVAQQIHQTFGKISKL